MNLGTEAMLLTRAQFARANGYSKSSVTRFQHAGRLVMVGDLVDPVASLKRIADTADPARDDVTRRHAEGRADGGLPLPPQGSVGRADNGYQGARALKEKYAALSAKLEYEKAAGDLIAKADVDASLISFATSVRAKLEQMADQLAPVLGPVTDLDEVHALLSEHARGLLVAVSEDMERAARAASAAAS